MKKKEFLVSDIDRCVDYSGPSKIEMIEVIEEKAGLYSCDIVFCNNLNKEIQEQSLKRTSFKIYS